MHRIHFKDTNTSCCPFLQAAKEQSKEATFEAAKNGSEPNNCFELVLQNYGDFSNLYTSLHGDAGAYPLIHTSSSFTDAACESGFKFVNGITSKSSTTIRQFVKAIKVSSSPFEPFNSKKCAPFASLSMATSTLRPKTDNLTKKNFRGSIRSFPGQSFICYSKPLKKTWKAQNNGFNCENTTIAFQTSTPTGGAVMLEHTNLSCESLTNRFCLSDLNNHLSSPLLTMSVSPSLALSPPQWSSANAQAGISHPLSTVSTPFRPIFHPSLSHRKPKSIRFSKTDLTSASSSDFVPSSPPITPLDSSCTSHPISFISQSTVTPPVQLQCSNGDSENKIQSFDSSKNSLNNSTSGNNRIVSKKRPKESLAVDCTIGRRLPKPHPDFFNSRLLRSLCTNSHGQLQCPAPIVAMRKAIAGTRAARELRPQSLPTKLTAVAVIATLVNIPCGMWREHCVKFSLHWFLAVHATIPFVAMLRKAIVMPKYAFFVTFVAAVAGQIIGSRLERSRLAAATDGFGGMLGGGGAGVGSGISGGVYSPAVVVMQDQLGNRDVGYNNISNHGTSTDVNGLHRERGAKTRGGRDLIKEHGRMLLSKGPRMASSNKALAQGNRLSLAGLGGGREQQGMEGGEEGSGTTASACPVMNTVVSSRAAVTATAATATATAAAAAAAAQTTFDLCQSVAAPRSASEI